MCLQKLKIGDQMPLEERRGIVGEDMPEPAWYALRCPIGRERAAREMLMRHDVHACYPERTIRYRQGGRVIKRVMPMFSQIVYAKFKSAPQWDVLRYRRIITGVFSIGDRPIVLPGDTVRVAMGLPTEAERIAAARAELLRVRGGDKARVVSGPLAGFLVDVTRVAEGRAWFETVTGIKGEAVVGILQRVQP